MANNKKWRDENPERMAAHRERWRAKNPGYYRRWRLQARYKLSPEHVDAMMEAQGGCCKACNDKLVSGHIDHCHKTGRVRGILCRECNTSLGLMRENPIRIARLAEYAEKHAASSLLPAPPLEGRKKGKKR